MDEVASDLVLGEKKAFLSEIPIIEDANCWCWNVWGLWKRFSSPTCKTNVEGNFSVTDVAVEIVKEY